MFNHRIIIANDDEVFSVKEWKELCEDNSIIDSDGSGFEVVINYDNYHEDYTGVSMLPSEYRNIPEHIKFVVWYNK